MGRDSSEKKRDEEREVRGQIERGLNGALLVVALACLFQIQECMQREQTGKPDESEHSEAQP